MKIQRIALLTMAAGLALGALSSTTHAEGEATFGGQWWTQNEPEAKYQEFRDFPRGPLLESFALTGWHDRYAWSLTGSNALRKDQLSRLRVTSGSRWRADFSYARIPHLFSRVAHSPFTEVAAGLFLLPDSLQIKNQRNPDRGGVTPYTNTMRDLLNTAPPVDLGFTTNVGKARLRGRPAPNWRLEVSGTERRRGGRKAYAASLGFSSSLELWEPIDQRMIDADMLATYHKDRVTVQASVGLSMFDNKVERMRWDNPKRLTDTTYSNAYVAGDGTAAGQLALYPDNRTYRGNVTLSLRLPQQSSLTAMVGMSQVRQDQTDWLPISINSVLRVDTIPLPGTHTDGRADVFTQDIRFTTRTVPNLTGTLRYNGYKYDNKTPEWHFPAYARFDQVLEPAVTTKAFGNDQKTFGVDLDYDLARGVSVGGVYEYRQREHSHREIDKDSENVFGVHARARAGDELTIQARYRRGQRELDAFHLADYQVAGDTTLHEQPGLRRFDVANRKRDEAGGGVTWLAHERLQVGTSYSYYKNDYDESPYGLQEDQQHAVIADATVHAHERIDLRGGYGITQTKTLQKSNESGAIVTGDVATDWVADIKDLHTFIFAGAEWFAAPDRLSFAADYELSRDYAGFRLSNTAGTARDVPSTKYLTHRAMFEARYRLFPGTRITGRYGWEQFDVQDFSAKDIPFITLSGGAAAAIYLGDFYRDYRAHRLALLVSHTF